MFSHIYIYVNSSIVPWNQTNTLLFAILSQFNEMNKDLMGWLEEAIHNLSADQSVSNDPVKIKAQIAKHKVRDRKCIENCIVI